MERRSYSLRSRVDAICRDMNLNEPIGSSSRLDGSVASNLEIVNADVTRINQEMADLIDSIHIANPGQRNGTVCSERVGHGSPMGLVAERQSDPAVVRWTRSDEEGSDPNVRIPCRSRRGVDAERLLGDLEDQMDQLQQTLAMLRARHKYVAEASGSRQSMDRRSALVRAPRSEVREESRGAKEIAVPELESTAKPGPSGADAAPRPEAGANSGATAAVMACETDTTTDTGAKPTTQVLADKKDE